MKSNPIKKILVGSVVMAASLFFTINTVSAQRFHSHYVHYVHSGFRPTAHFAPIIRNYGNYGAPCRYARPCYGSPYVGGYFHYPTIGLRIGILPIGYTSFFLGGMPYYYANSVYYRRVNENNYEVIAPPLGAKLPQLPKNARVVYIDGNKYYELDGKYYQEELNSRNQVLYTVVGTNGSLNQPSSQGNANTYHEPQVGDVYNQLPEQCELVTLNGKQYYLSKSNIFYEAVRNGNGVVYKVVGK